MSKHDQAMKDINVIAENLTITQSLELNKMISTVRNYINDMEVLEKTLTPPTVDEVCEALSEQLKQKVSYDAMQFYYKIKNTEHVMFVTETYGNGLWSLGVYLPPHLITLIGRFYEGLEK